MFVPNFKTCSSWVIGRHWVGNPSSYPSLDILDDRLHESTSTIVVIFVIVIPVPLSLLGAFLLPSQRIRVELVPSIFFVIFRRPFLEVCVFIRTGALERPHGELEVCDGIDCSVEGVHCRNVGVIMYLIYVRVGIYGLLKMMLEIMDFLVWSY